MGILLQSKKALICGLYYVGVLLFGGVLGWGGVTGYEWFKPKYQAGDYSNYVSQAGAKNVVMLGSRTCPACASARSFFKVVGVDYVELDVKENEMGQRMSVELQLNFVPIIIFNDKLYAGFNREAIGQELTKRALVR